MSNPSVSTTIKVRRDTSANWATHNPVLSLGEPGWDTTTNTLKFGDGVNTWSNLPAINGSGGGGISQIQSDWNQTNTSLADYIKNKPSNLSQFTNDLNLATVAVTGNYNDLTNLPNLINILTGNTQIDGGSAFTYYDTSIGGALINGGGA